MTRVIPLMCAALGLACAASDDDAPDEAPAAPCDHAELDTAQKRRAEQLTSLFENGTVELAYGYAEALDDGRGITAGRAGFTSATGDLLEVVERHVDAVPDSPLAPYLPRLRELASTEDGSLDGLDGFIAAWTALANDAELHAAQDAVVDQEYYQPALAIADAHGLCPALGIAVLYDSIIQHGEGDDPDGLPALVERTVDAVGEADVDPHAWTRKLLEIRRDDLAHAFDPDTREVWAESVGRVDVLRTIADDGNWELAGPIVVEGEYEGVVD